MISVQSLFTNDILVRFGDQILQVNGENVAGHSTEKVHDILKKAGVNNITMAVRDRPFERTLTLHKVCAMSAK